jgi:hypothetical protein
MTVLVIRRAIGEADGGICTRPTPGATAPPCHLDPERDGGAARAPAGVCEVAERLGITLIEELLHLRQHPGRRHASRPSTVSRHYYHCAAKLSIKTSLHKLRHHSATELITADLAGQVPDSVGWPDRQ